MHKSVQWRNNIDTGLPDLSFHMVWENVFPSHCGSDEHAWGCPWKQSAFDRQQNTEYLGNLTIM